MEMKKLSILILFSFFVTSSIFSQTGWFKIYSDDTTSLGIYTMNSVKINGLNKKQIYIQRGISFINNPNQSGKYLKLNGANNSWYVPANGYLNPDWCYCYNCIPPHFICNSVFSFAVSPLDSQFIIKNIPSCGIDEGDQTYITYNNGANYINLSQFSNGFAGIQNYGYDIDPVNDNIIYIGYPIIGSSYKCIYKSTNRGTNWIATDTNSNFSQHLLKINPLKRTNLFVNGSPNLMMSTTSGTDFFNVDSPLFTTMTFDPVDSAIYGTGYNNMYKSSNGGLNWVQVAAGFYSSVEISPVNHNIVYAGNVNGLFRSVNGGQTWVLYNNSFTPSRNVIGLSMDQARGDTVIAATRDAVYKVWGSYVGIEKISSVIPESFSLHQNYPNPFNPATKIKFDIPSVGQRHAFDTRLIIYDILGKEVATLVNEQLQPGIYSVEFNAANYPSGIYYYKLESGTLIETKKMILIK